MNTRTRLLFATAIAIGAAVFVMILLFGISVRGAPARSPRDAAEPTNAPMVKAIAMKIPIPPPIPTAPTAQSGLSVSEVSDVVIVQTNNSMTISWKADTNHMAYYVYSKTYGLNAPLLNNTNLLLNLPTSWNYLGMVTNTNSVSMATIRATNSAGVSNPITNAYFKVVKCRIP